MTPPAPASPPAPRWRFDRWWGLVLGAGWALADTILIRALGITFTVNGSDATLVTGVFFGSSFVILGYLLGWASEARRREAAAAAVIRAQAAEMAAARARLAQSEKLAALGQLATAIAHEVRNPLAVIRSAAQDLGEGAAPGGEAARACEFIVAEIDRLTKVVTSLLAFARPPTLSPRAVAVGELFDRTLLLARDELAGKGATVARHVSPDVPALRCDPDLACQVLLGLVANAVAALPPGGEVALEARAVGGEVELGVADSGPGVPAEVRGRIFEPFFTTRPDGTGLGLAVARQIVEAHGGRIAVGDRPGGGARFVVRLPAMEAARAA